MKMSRKRTLPKIWLSVIAIGILFIGFAGGTAKAANNNSFTELASVSDFMFSKTEGKGSPLFENAAFVDSVQFTAATYTVDEGAGFAVITVSRTGGSATAATVDYNLADGGTGAGFATGGVSCTAGVDYVNTNGTLTFNVGVISQSFTVPICEDALIEATEGFNVFLANPNGVLVGSPSAAVVQITDNDQAGPGTFQFSAATYTVGENGGNATLTVTRTGGSNGSATLNYTLANGTATGGATCATAGVDYVNTGGTVVFATGQTTATITVPVCDDGIVEGNETFTATIAGQTAGTLGTPTTATVTIVDNEVNSPGVVQFAQGLYNVREGLGTVTLTVNRTGGTSGAVSVGYSISNSSAVGGTACTAGVDFINPGPGMLNFTSGQGTTATTATITITICSDNVDELNESFDITLVNPVGGVTIGSPQTTSVLILDDENGVFQFNPLTYTVAENAGTVSVTVTRTGLAGSGAIGRVSVDYTTSNTTTTTTNAQGGTSCGATVNGVPVDYISQNGTLTFDPGVTSQTFGIQICDDSTFEINSETFSVTLSNPQTISGGVGAPLLGTAAVIAQTGGSNTTVATVTITDNDTAQPGVFNVSAAPTTVTEGGSSVVTITRSGGSDTAVQITVTTTNGTAIGGTSCTTGVDYINPGVLTGNFTNSQTSGGTQTASFTIVTCDDTVFEPNETLTVTLSNPTGGSTLGANSSVTITILDNDAQAGTIQFAATTASVIESAASVPLTVTRTNGSDVAVSATVSFGGGTATGGAACTTAGVDYVNTAQTVSFAAGQTSATVNVPICQDSTVEGNETFVATLSTPIGGVTLGANTTATVTILDDEGGTLQFSQANYQANENVGFVTVTVTRLAGQSGANGTVSVDYTLTDGTATGGVTCTGTADYINPAGAPDGTLTFGNAVTTQTFNIQICDDLLNEGNETINIALSNPTPAGSVVIGPQGTATVTIVDNDAAPTLAINNVTLPEGNAGTTNFVFNVTLSAASGQQATINFATADGTATGGAACTGNVDYIAQNGTLTFAAGTTTQAVTVQVCGDLNFEPNETFFVNLTGAVNTTVPANTQGIGTITNDDGAPGTITVVGTSAVAGSIANGGTIRVPEGDTGATNAVTFTLTNANPNGLPASVQFTTANAGTANGTSVTGTATGGAACTAGVDYITQSGTANFAANATTSTPITITVCGDVLKEANETIFLTFSNATNTNVATGTQGVVIIVDNDRQYRADFDRDRRSDYSVFRPSNGFWYILQTQFGNQPLLRAVQFGANGDLPVPGDYDNDGATDLAYFRPSTGTFTVLQSSNNVTVSTQLGISTDLPVPGDYDGDGDTDPAVFRPSSGTFFTSTNPATNFGAIQFGQNGDIPVPADYDGDGKTDVAIFRPNGVAGIGAAWFVRYSSTGQTFGIQYGASTDIPVVGDVDGDGKADFTVFRTTGNPTGVAGAFYTFQSLTQTSTGIGFGQAGDVPAFGDYDGDGTIDVAVFRPSVGTFYVRLSSTGGFTQAQFGTQGDIPIASRYQPNLIP